MSMPTCSRGRVARASALPRSFAAMAALCRGEKKPCGACGPCRRVLSGTHPDVHTVVPEKGKQIIGVGVMREVLDTVSVKSFEDGAKVILIPEAERMTPPRRTAC